MDQDQADRKLRKYYRRIAGLTCAGYDEYRGKSYPRRAVHRPATQATIINDEIVAKAIQEFSEDPEVRLVEIKSKNLRFLQIGNILLWFKKIDGQRKFKVYPTEHATDLASGQLSLFPDTEVLVVGYLLKRDGTAVSMVSILKPNGRRAKPAWYIDLEIQSRVVAMPQRSSEQNRPRVRVKLGAVQNKLIGE